MSLSHTARTGAATSNPAFGLTTLGPSDPISDATAAAGVAELAFHTISPAEYTAAFDAHLLGDCHLARNLGVDGATVIPRKELCNVLHDLLGRVPSQQELTTWLTYTDYDRGAFMTYPEYQRAVEDLVLFCAEPQAPRQYKSYTKIMADRFKHTRRGYEPQRTLRAPMTDSQRVGWHTLKTHVRSPTDVHVPNKSTDVTINEGWSPVMYYGFFNVF